MNLKNKIKEISLSILPEIIAIRRHLHKYPELSTLEYKTAEFISSKLKEYNIDHKTGVAKTGVVGLINGTEGLRTIGLRADMDALPITEKNEIDYKSINEGVMHACGHDAHIACLLGTAKVLALLKNDLKNNVKLIFQPSEEKYPGGAIQMINEGVLENPKVDIMIAQHTLPEMETGKIGIKNGKFMASTDEIFLIVKGKGGHAATPDKNIDTILIASHIIIALQQIVSRFAKPTIPTVISFGKISSDGRTNIMPDEVRIEGTMRTFSEEWRKEIYDKINKISKSVAEAMGGSCEVIIDKGYPFLINDESLTNGIKLLAKDFLGEENVEDLDLRMTAEDFAYYSQQIPSCLYRLGTGNKTKGITSNLHTSTFNIDENALLTGTEMLSCLAIGL